MGIAIDMISLWRSSVNKKFLWGLYHAGGDTLFHRVPPSALPAVGRVQCIPRPRSPAARNTATGLCRVLTVYGIGGQFTPCTVFQTVKQVLSLLNPLNSITFDTNKITIHRNMNFLPKIRKQTSVTSMMLKRTVVVIRYEHCQCTQKQQMIMCIFYGLNCRKSL